jgi:HEAT repeat protein
MEPVPQSAVPALQAALKDLDAMVRVHVATALCGLPGQGRVAVPVLISALKDRAWRVGAVTALATVGPEAKEALPALLATLADDQSDVALAVSIGTTLVRIDASQAAEGILRVLAAAAKKSRPRIVYALGQAGPAGVAPLVRFAEDEDPAVRAAAVGALASSRRSSADLVPALIKALRDKDPLVRRAAFGGLGQVGTTAKAAVQPTNLSLNVDQRTKGLGPCFRGDVLGGRWVNCFARRAARS